MLQQIVTLARYIDFDYIIMRSVCLELPNKKSQSDNLH